MPAADTIDGILWSAAERSPDRPAVLSGAHVWSYHDLARVTSRVMTALTAAGVRRGDHVALFIENSPEFIAAHYAVTSLGAVIVSMNTHLRDQGLAEAVALGRPVAVVTSPPLLDSLAALAVVPECLNACVVLADGDDPERMSVRRGSFSDLKGPSLVADIEPMAPRGVADSADPAVLFLTSGTTGTPKGILVTHTQVLLGVDAWTNRWGFGPETVSLMVAPYFHVVYNPLVLGAHRHRGAAAVVSNLQARAATREAERTRATAIMGTPFFFMQLLGDTTSRSRDLSRIEQVIYGAAPTPVPVIGGLRERFREARLFNCYGLTETCSAVSCLDSSELPGREASVGQAHPGVEISVRDLGHQAVPAGTVGEVYCRGRNVITHYYGAPAVTASRFHEGWLRTGDLGHLDAEGYLYLVGRADDVINVAGEKAYPTEIEDVLYAFPGVLDAAVCAVPDPAKGHRVKALLVLRDAATIDLAGLRRFCAQRLPAAFVPRVVEIVEALPRNAAGKVLRSALVAADSLLS